MWRYFYAMVDHYESKAIKKVTDNPVLRDQYKIVDKVNMGMLLQQG